MSTERPYKEHIDRIFQLCSDTIGHLYICHYFNSPYAYRDQIKYNIDIDDGILFSIFSKSSFIRNYQWFSWKLFVIELCKIISIRDSYSLNQLKIKIDDKSFDKTGRYTKVSQRIEEIHEKNTDLIKKFRTLRDKVYAHSDHLNDKPPVPDFKECWNIIEEIKSVFLLIGSIEDNEYSFNGFKTYLPIPDEIESIYTKITNPRTEMEKKFLESLVDRSYLQKKGILK